MDYQTGKPGRIIVVRFSDGEDVLGGIADICRTENIRTACLNIVGAMKGGRFIVGPETEDMPPVPVWRELQESHEAVGFGTVFWDKEQPISSFPWCVR
jgi:uncharacterized protein